MSTELTKPKYAVVMKNGLLLFLSEEKANSLKEHLVNLENHGFVELTEIGQTINTAEVAGIYTPDQYADMNRIKAGDYKCQYGRWHTKRDVCDCARQIRIEHRRNEEARKREEDARPPSPEERKAVAAQMAAMREDMVKRGVLPPGKNAKAVLKRSKLNEYEKKFGRPYDVPAGYTIEEDTDRASGDDSDREALSEESVTTTHHD